MLMSIIVRLIGRPRDLILAVGGRRNDALMDFMEPLVNGSLLCRMLAVHPKDQVMRRFEAVEVGVVMVAEEKLTPCRRMGSDPPTARLVTVVFLYELIDGSADGAENAELGEIRTEPGPESVVRT
jgi:hypothetical protein